MSVLALLIPVSLVLAIVFVAACLIAIRKGQFDDMESPRWKLLFDAPPSASAEPPSRDNPSPETEVRS